MERIYTTAIVGGGAAGLFLATLLNENDIAVFERNERVGRKLSATGNGQGNVTNVHAKTTPYFSLSSGGARAQTLVQKYDDTSLCAHLERCGLLLVSDERGRVYPAGRQASAITDALRFRAAQKGAEIFADTQITGIEKRNGLFVLTARTKSGERQYLAKTVALCAGGNAAKNFGTDGAAYALAQKFGHTRTALFPSLVQLKTDTTHIKTLKGIRVSPARVTAAWREGNAERSETQEGDVIFTDYGVSGDVVFRLSAFFADKLENGVRLYIDLLPAFTEERIERALREKRENFPETPDGELLCGMLNNQVARAVVKSSERFESRAVAKRAKAFPLDVKGTLGFDYAQVTKGGVPLFETDENLQSKLVDGLYFAGEILDVDGPCGGFNLQWAYSSACAVAEGIENAKRRGQV